MSSRIQTTPSPCGVDIQIKAKRDWSALIFIPIWLAFWTFGGIGVMKWVLHPTASTPRTFISLWLIGWAFGEVWAVYSWFWSAFGKEIVQINEAALTVKKDILGHGRRRVFPLASIRNLRAAGIFPASSNWENMLIQTKLRGGTVAFDIDGKTARFGIQLMETEAQEVVEALKPWLSA